MLILTRRVGETVMIGNDVTVTILGVKGNQVRVGVNAPRDVAVHRVALGSSGLGPNDMEIHQAYSILMAVALNSAVPTSGSVASMVSTFVATSSGKWKVIKVRPGRSPSSM